MAKISALPELATANVDGTETLPIVKGGTTFRAVAKAFIERLALPFVNECKANAAIFKSTVGFDNLVNPDAVTIGQALNSTGGATVANAAFYTTDYMPAIGAATYARAATAANKFVAFYAADLTHITTITVLAAATTFNVPNVTVGPVAFMRTSARIDESPPATFQIVEGTALPATYNNYFGFRPMAERIRNQANAYAALDADGFVRSSGIKTEADTVDLFVKATVNASKALDGSTGALVTNANFFTTDYIAVVAGAKYRFPPASSVKYVDYYDASKAYIRTALSLGTFTVPKAIVGGFTRISMRYSDVPVASAYVIKGELPIERRITAQAKPLAGKIIAGLGDSITYGFIPRNAPGYPGQLQSYLPLIADELGATFLNYGISGSTLANKDGTHDPMTGRYSAMSDTADLVIVMGGINDVTTGVSLGVMGDTTDATYYGALDVLCQGLLQKYRYAQGTSVGANKKIMFMTPPRALKADFSGLETGLEPFCAAMKQVCAKYAIPVFDAYNLSGLTPELFRTLQGTQSGYTSTYNPYMPDGKHPTQEGNMIFKLPVAGFIRSLY